MEQAPQAKLILPAGGETPLPALSRIRKHRPKGITERQIVFPFGQAARATRTVSSGTNVMDSGEWSNMLSPPISSFFSTDALWLRPLSFAFHPAAHYHADERVLARIRLN
jgi:hypothetical protein